jgi:large subunit ribosomal protein L23Ae
MAVTGGLAWPFEMSAKAESAAAAVASGQKKQVKKVRHFKKFKKPTTVAIPRKPAYEHQAIAPVSLKRNDYKIIRCQVASDKASRKLESENTMVFWVDLRATKSEIKAAVQRLYNAKPAKVSTLITAKCLKKAYVRFPPTVEPMSIANEMA